MGKLHELLAVETDLRKTSERLVAESIKTCKKDNLFTGTLKRTEIFDDEAPKIADEYLKLETTVFENLEYSMGALAKYWDAVAQKDASNAKAVADVVIDGKILLSGVPGVTLLGMEKKLSEIKNLINAIPTLHPGIDWVKDDGHERLGVYKAKHDIETLKTQKDIEFREMSPATREHKAQIQPINITKSIGRFITTKWSSMITPHNKAKLSTNVEILLLAVKKARQRANEVEVVDIQIGNKMINFIMEN